MPIPTPPAAAALHPGAFVRVLGRQEATFQLISLDEETGSGWVRRWPLTRHGSPAFPVTLSQLRPLQAPNS